MKYKDQLIKSMEWLAEQEDTVFIGQSVSYSGNAIFNTLSTVAEEKRLEVPVFEEIQMGIATGMALEGYTPISCYPRFDFLMRAMDQLVNHLDKFQIMTDGEWKPRVIIRTSIGSTNPLNGGVQHTMDYTEALQSILGEVEIVLLDEPKDIMPEFRKAYEREGSTLLIEYGDHYNDK
jgi:pyruvate/2-oxoglutarate/acetoin dehydrogenase E1 component